ncbi:MAG: hypothetical protein ACLU3I_21865 [Acutalibacteraceae bacterium]
MDAARFQGAGRTELVRRKRLLRPQRAGDGRKPSTCTVCAENVPEAVRLPQRTLPATFPAPLVHSSPAQSTSP